MCFPGGENISPGIYVSLVTEHISVGISVSQVGEHISPGICVSQVEEHTSLGICVSQMGEHISLGTCVSQVRRTLIIRNICVSQVRNISLVICVSQVTKHILLPLPGKHISLGEGTHITRDMCCNRLTFRPIRSLTSPNRLTLLPISLNGRGIRLNACVKSLHPFIIRFLAR